MMKESNDSPYCDITCSNQGECLLKMASIDRISDLPDSLVQHIMSFLESQEAVQTCVLSKRWKNMWASLPCLHLDLSKFKTSGHITKRFMNFVDNLLLLRDTSNLHTVRLTLDGNNYPHVCHTTFMTWILYVFKCNAKVIELNVGYKILPQCMFNSETLEELSLLVLLKYKARAINLPRLKKLELDVDSYESDILNKLALGCPALEVLTLCSYHINMRVVSFPKLKYLNISSRGKDTCVESIRTPNLVSLVLKGYAKHFKETSLEKMSSLMNATISLWRCYCFDVEKCNLLRDIANAQNLELTESTIQALIEKGLPRCPTLFNLTTLSLRYFCMICHSNEVGDILKHTHNLKKLTLCGDSFYRDGDVEHECHMEVDQGSNSIKSALWQCKNLDEIEVELERINVRTKQVVNALVESLAELKTTHLILSVRYTRSTISSPTEFHRFCLSMVQGKNVLTLLGGNKFDVWSTNE